jgi:hypothetical protein
MSVRVVARIRPLLKAEHEKDVIVQSSAENGPAVRIPNPKNAGEEFTFAFNSVYSMETKQEELFQNEGEGHLNPTDWSSSDRVFNTQLRRL